MTDLHDVVPVSVGCLMTGQGCVVELLPTEPSLSLASYQDLCQSSNYLGVQFVHLTTQF